MSNDLTLVVPALNEELHIRTTIEEARGSLTGLIDDYEIIVFNDGSTDGTGRIAEELAASDDRVRVVHHAEPLGLGYVYKAGVRAAEKSNVLLVPGDNELRADSLTEICGAIGRADMVLTYALNPEIRRFNFPDCSLVMLIPYFYYQNISLGLYVVFSVKQMLKTPFMGEIVSLLELDDKWNKLSKILRRHSLVKAWPETATPFMLRPQKKRVFLKLLVSF